MAAQPGVGLLTSLEPVNYDR